MNHPSRNMRSYRRSQPDLERLEQRRVMCAAGADFIPSSGQVNDGIPTLVYDLASGNLQLETDGVQLASLELNSCTSAFTGNSPTALSGSFDVFNPNKLFKFDLDSGFTDLDFGPVLAVEQPQSLNNMTFAGSPLGGGPLMALDYRVVGVVGRHVFYNNSNFDGHTAAATAADDFAIANDKLPLRAGGTATLANYTNYARGINGVIVDLAGSKTPNSISAADFIFRRGTDSGVASWSVAPSPAVSVRPGDGVNGTDRVTLIWTDGTLVNQWIQVTVRATTVTQLSSNDVFYYGNLVGETAAVAGLAAIDLVDLQQTFAQLLTPASVDSAFDVDRSGQIDFLDIQAIHPNLFRRLELISVPNSVNLGRRSSFDRAALADDDDSSWARRDDRRQLRLAAHDPHAARFTTFR